MDQRLPGPARNPVRSPARRRSGLRDYPAVLWLIAAVVVAVIHRTIAPSGPPDS